MHSPTALTAFLRDALDGDVADGMKVVAGSGMNVTVQAGTARVGRDPSYDINVTGAESVDVGAASPSNPMNAVIVAYVDRNVAGSASVTDNTNDVFKLKAVSGAAASSPSDPSSSAIQSAIGAANPYIILARVRKRAGATSIIASDITDMRVMATLKAGRINSSSMLADDVIKSGHLSDGIVLPRHIKKTDFQLPQENGWNVYINPINGKKRYWREGNIQSSPINHNGFQYLDTGISFPSGTRVVSTAVRVTDQSISATAQAVSKVSFCVQSHYNGARAHVYWYYELEQV